MADADGQDRVLVDRLEAGTLAPAEFNHRNHVRAARHYLLTLGLPGAAHRFTDVLTAYVRVVGAEGKFHRTLTLALLHLMNARLQPGQDFEQFAAAFPELFSDAKGLLARHYSPALLMSDEARLRFQEPDRAPLPRSPDEGA